MSRSVKAALKDAKLPGFRVYDLRHTYASLLLAHGAPISYVAAQLGHARPTTTLAHYARWIPKEGKNWAALVDIGPGGQENRGASPNDSHNSGGRVLVSWLPG